VTDLATRYGSPPASRRRAVAAVVAVLVVVSLAWLTWVVLDQADPAVTSETISFEVVDEHAATATFAVARRSSDVRASCLLRAQSPDHATVGELNVAVGPGGEPEQVITRTVRTERLATTVDVVGCSAPGQPQRR
jgi:hypothetical protein